MIKNTCQCSECKEIIHQSDCAVHNEPAFPKEPCDCGVKNYPPPPWRCDLTDSGRISKECYAIRGEGELGDFVCYVPWPQKSWVKFILDCINRQPKKRWQRGDSNKPYCCERDCGEDAEFQIFCGSNPMPDNCTNSCRFHVGNLLCEGHEHHIFDIDVEAPIPVEAGR